ncbi:hypothetical protein ACFQPG_11695 [Sphingomonas sp. GCM10030256]|uniref:hypothetical protein n=1 Tax=Sphingomonas sp. GCM10030256 TaxID=3273427 RepID=UPI0036095F59
MNRPLSLLLAVLLTGVGVTPTGLAAGAEAECMGSARRAGGALAGQRGSGLTFSADELVGLKMHALMP